MTVIIADDHSMVRSGLRALLQGDSEVQIVAEAADGATAVRLAHELQPDVVIMDIDMPGVNGIEATRQINANGSGAKVIALTALASAQAARQMLQAGARGFVAKTEAYKEFRAALSTVSAGKIYVSPSVDSSLRGQGNGTANGQSTALTARESDVLKLISEGWATKEIASQLAVSIKTVETHRKHLMDKLDLHSVAELTKYAMREGLTGS